MYETRDENLKPIVPTYSDQFIPKELKIVWVCNEHETCKTCKYFYFSCDGLHNKTDPRVQATGRIESLLIQRIWGKLTEKESLFVYWQRLKEIGIILNTLDQVKEFNHPDHMEQILKEKGLV